MCQIITPESISAFESYLYKKEKSAATIEKYLRDVNAFYSFAKGMEVSR